MSVKGVTSWEGKDSRQGMVRAKGKASQRVEKERGQQCYSRWRSRDYT